MKMTALPALFVFVLGGACAHGSTVDDAVGAIAHHWAKANYGEPDAQKPVALDKVVVEAQEAAQEFPGRAEPLVWEAIALSSAAKAEGGFGALRKARQARDLLLAAEKIDSTAIHGAVYASLGSLYANVPGWPISFGDKKKARAYFEKALTIAPDDIDANYFYADFLAAQEEYADAELFAKRALAAPSRPGRSDADAGRREEVRALLKTLRTKQGAAYAAQ